VFPLGYSLQSNAVRQGLKKGNYTNISENINKKQIEFMTYDLLDWVRTPLLLKTLFRP
jgi:hypothetical protein